ncbi:hypothetical protein OAJ57_04065 [Alphaproteobacteria bacterium]|nr:hypothetical protein [Alphaproteobacteria bacterium]
MAANTNLDGTTTRHDESFDGQRLVLIANPLVLGGPANQASFTWKRIS